MADAACDGAAAESSSHARCFARGHANDGQDGGSRAGLEEGGKDNGGGTDGGGGLHGGGSSYADPEWDVWKTVKGLSLKKRGSDLSSFDGCFFFRLLV